MRKTLLLIFMCLLILISCSEKDVETNINHAKPAGSLDKMEFGRGFAGEIDAEKPYRNETEEKIIKTAYASIDTNTVEEA